MADFQDADWNTYGPPLVSALALKRVGKEYVGPCVVCGGHDRMRAVNYQGKVRIHCRQCQDIGPLNKLREDGLLPSLGNKGDNVVRINPLSNFPMYPETDDRPYLERKAIPAMGAKLEGDDLIVDLENIDGEATHQRILPNGEKRFKPGTDLSKATFAIYGPLTENSEDDVWICEGYADAVSIFLSTKQTAVHGLSCTHLPLVAKALQKKYPKAKFKIAADNDEAGLAAAKKTRLPYATPIDPGTDFSDVFVTLGAQAVCNMLQKVQKPIRGLMQLVSEFETTEPVWLAEGRIEENVLSIMYGQSGTYKSFIAIDLAVSIAAGEPFAGQPTMQGAVAYIANEGHNGFTRRVQAKCAGAGIAYDQTLPFYLNRKYVVLDNETVDELIADLEEAQERVGPWRLVVLDTLDRTIEGIEDDNADTKEYLNHCDRIRTHFGATVLIIAHVGHQAKNRAKGSTKLRDRMDASYRITSAGDLYVNMVCDKMKDAEPPDPLTFAKREQDVVLPDGVVVSSLVLEPVLDMPQPGERSPEYIRYAILAEYRKHNINGDIARTLLKEHAADELGMSQRQVNTYIKAMIDDGIFAYDRKIISAGENYVDE